MIIDTGKVEKIKVICGSCKENGFRKEITIIMDFELQKNVTLTLSRMQAKSLQMMLGREISRGLPEEGR